MLESSEQDKGQEFGLGMDVWPPFSLSSATKLPARILPSISHKPLTLVFSLPEDFVKFPTAIFVQVLIGNPDTLHIGQVLSYPKLTVFL